MLAWTRPDKTRDLISLAVAIGFRWDDGIALHIDTAVKLGAVAVGAAVSNNAGTAILY